MSKWINSLHSLDILMCIIIKQLFYYDRHMKAHFFQCKMLKCHRQCFFSSSLSPVYNMNFRKFTNNNNNTQKASRQARVSERDVSRQDYVYVQWQRKIGAVETSPSTLYHTPSDCILFLRWVAFAS